MPVQKADFANLYPCDFSTPAQVLESDLMYTVPEVARRLQGLDPDADLEPDTEAVLVDWAIPWIVHYQERLVVGEPLDPDGPGYYGVRGDDGT